MNIWPLRYLSPIREPMSIRCDLCVSSFADHAAVLEEDVRVGSGRKKSICEKKKVEQILHIYR